MTEKNIPSPPRRIHRPRSTEEMRNMKPGESMLMSLREALAFKARGVYHGWVTQQQMQADGQIRVWRIS